jgi:hypothetical protein
VVSVGATALAYEDSYGRDLPTLSICLQSWF